MTTTLDHPRVGPFVAELLADAEANDDRAIARARTELGDDPDPSPARLSSLLADAYLPVSADVGRILYLLARLRPAPLVVEFGMSLAVSTLHLAAAVRDGGEGHVVTTELDPGKATRGMANLERAGLADLVEVRTGDARSTLAELDGPIGLLHLDGWKELTLDLLGDLEDRLAPGAIVVCDDTDRMSEQLAAYLRHVRDPAHGYASVALGVGDGVEVSIRR